MNWTNENKSNFQKSTNKNASSQQLSREFTSSLLFSHSENDCAKDTLTAPLLWKKMKIPALVEEEEFKIDF